MTCGDQSWSSVTFVNQRPTSPLIETTFVWPSSSRYGKFDDTWRPIMVIRRLCQPEASEPTNMQRPTWSLVHFHRRLNVYWPKLSQPLFIAILRQSSLMTRKDCNGHTLFSIQRQSSPIACRDTSWLSAPSSSRDGKSDDARRPIMFICHLCQPEASEPVDRDYFSLTFVIQRQQSDDTWKQHMVVRTLLIQRLSKSPLSSRDRQVRWYPGWGWSSASNHFEDFWKFTFVIQRRSSSMTRKDSFLLTRDNQVW